MRTMKSSSGTTVAAAGAAQYKHPAIVYILVGGVFLLFFLICLMTDVQTSEAFILHSGRVSMFRPDWSIFLQIPNLLLGQLSPEEAKATIWGWGLECIFVGFTLAFDLMKDSVRVSGRAAAIIFEGMALIIVGYNFVANFMYGEIGTGFWGQVGFAGITSFVVAFFGIIGVNMILAAWKRTA